MEDKMFGDGKKSRLLSLERRLGGEAKMFVDGKMHRILSSEEDDGEEVKKIFITTPKNYATYNF